MSKSIKSLVEFIAAIKEISLTGGSLGKFIFRGQSNETWPVASGVVRRLKESKLKNGHKHPEKLTKEEIVFYLEECIRETRKRENSHSIIKGMSDLRLLAEMQHYGAATPLIDFSYNSLIALYMAAASHIGKKGENGKVFCINYNKRYVFNEIVDYQEFPETERFRTISEILEEVADKIILYRPYHSNTRIIKQESLFVLNSKGILESNDIDAEIIIDKNAKEGILSELCNISGLSEESVYPDFLGYLQANNAQRGYTLKKPIEFFELGNEFRLRNDNKNGESKNIQKAIEYYSKAIELDRTLDQPHFEKGFLELEYLKDYDRAIESFSAAIQLTKNDSDAWYNRGIAYHERWLSMQKRADFDQAKKDYLNAIRLNKGSVPPINNLADLLNSFEAYEEAKKWFRKGLVINNADPDLWFGLGEVCFNQKRYKYAAKYFLKSFVIKPDDSVAAFNVGLCYLKLKQLREAEKFFLKGIKLDKDNVDCYSHLGQVYFRLNKIDKAYSYFVQGVKSDSQSAEMFNNIGFCELRLGKLEEASTNLKKGIELGCKDFAQKNLGHYHLCKGEFETAIKMYKASLQAFQTKKEFFLEFSNDYEDLRLSQYPVSKSKYKKVEKEILD